jgi:hypothetical protein
MMWHKGWFADIADKVWEREARESGDVMLTRIGESSSARQPLAFGFWDEGDAFRFVGWKREGQ